MLYPIHKGIDRPATFKGLSLRSWVVIGVGFLITFISYFVLTAMGVSFLVSTLLSVGFFVLLFWCSKEWEQKYGKHGFTKSRVRSKIGSGVIVRSVRGVLKVQKE